MIYTNSAFLYQPSYTIHYFFYKLALDLDLDFKR